MKNINKVLVVIMACFVFLLAGCSEGAGVTLIQNSDGTVTQTYYSPFPAEKIITLLGNNISARVSVENALNKVAKYCNDEVFKPWIDNYKLAIENSEKLTDEEKEILKNGVKISNNLYDKNGSIQLNIEEVVYYVDFDDAKTYQYFMSANGISEKRTVVKENSLFLTKTITTKIPFFENKSETDISIGKKIIKDIDRECSKSFGYSRWESLKAELGYENFENTLDYTYAVPTGRLHSDAKTVTKYQGYYFHTWSIPLDQEEDIKLQYWTITANRWIWYTLAFAGGLTVIIATLIVSKKKDKQEKFEK